jgi:hypothetical protein
MTGMTGRRIVRFERLEELTPDAEDDSVFHRSVQLAQTLIDHQLVDERCMMVFPAGELGPRADDAAEADV